MIGIHISHYKYLIQCIFRFCKCGENVIFEVNFEFVLVSVWRIPQTSKNIPRLLFYIPTKTNSTIFHLKCRIKCKVESLVEYFCYFLISVDVEYSILSFHAAVNIVDLDISNITKNVNTLQTKILLILCIFFLNQLQCPIYLQTNIIKSGNVELKKIYSEFHWLTDTMTLPVSLKTSFLVGAVDIFNV